MLGPQLFTIYIDDLEEGAECRVTKFVDDTKMSGKANCMEGVERLKRDLDRLSEWARTWQMEYNVGKCEIIHFGRSNSRRDYYLKGEKLQHATVQRDLGVLVNKSHNSSLQVQQLIKKANGMLAFIAREIEYKSREVLLQL